jgi:hypothetical protein
MFPTRIFTHSKAKLTLALTLASVLTLLTLSGALAALYTIDTNNNSAAEWSSVPVFQTDPNNDVATSCDAADGRDEIIQTKVASGPASVSFPTHIYFQITTLAADALSVSGHIASVYIDCDRDGVAEVSDRNAIYKAPVDDVTLCEGQEPNPVNCLLYGIDGPPKGERPGDALSTVEYGIPIADLPAACQEQVDIKFRTVKLYTSGPQQGLFECLFDETPFRGWDIPTDVTLASMNASSGGGQSYLIYLSVAALLLAVAAGGIGLYIYKRQSAA